MTRPAGLSAALLLSVIACSEGTAPSSEVSQARKWIETTIVVQEDIENPCNGEIIHLTSLITFLEAFEKNGRERGRFRLSGTGFSDEGTQYQLRSAARANALPFESEKVMFHEQLIGSKPGSSYRRRVQAFFHLDGTAEVHEVFKDRLSCR